MSLRDQFETNLEEALTKARNQKQIEAALRTAIAGEQAAVASLREELAAAQASGVTDEQLTAWRDKAQAIEDTLEPGTFVEGVMANTPTPAAGSSGGSGNAG